MNKYKCSQVNKGFKRYGPVKCFVINGQTTDPQIVDWLNPKTVTECAHLYMSLVPLTIIVSTLFWKYFKCFTALTKVWDEILNPMLEMQTYILLYITNLSKASDR